MFCVKDAILFCDFVEKEWFLYKTQNGMFCHNMDM